MGSSTEAGRISQTSKKRRILKKEWYYSKGDLQVIKILEKKEPAFHLKAGDASYLFSVFHGFLIHHYCGPAITDDEVEYLMVQVDHDSVVPHPADVEESWFSCDIAATECSGNQTGDYRPAAVSVQVAEGDSSFAGTTATELRYVSHEIQKGKPVLDIQPAVYASEDEAETLIVKCQDLATGVTFRLYYTVFEKYPVICRRMVIENTTKEKKALNIRRAYSACLDFTTIEPQAEMVHLWGTWGRERYIERSPLIHGSMSVSSTRGVSSHHHNPFAAIVTKETTEEYGFAVGMSLIYSGNFDITCDVDPFGMIRLLAGINPVDFTWYLEYGAHFCTPEAVIVISDSGLGKMSRIYHKIYRTHLCRGEWKEKQRPVLINNWEATYFDFTEEKLLEIAKTAAECGIEMLVMDDGWFGKRNDGTSSLGDWFVNEEKIPSGLNKLVSQVNAFGMKFGIWFEPEAISPKSQLYKEHPDWCLHIEGREKSLARKQYMLDITRRDVRDYLFEVFSRILSSANIEYIKWDCNRNLTEAGSMILPVKHRQEMFHRYVLGLYELLDRLTSAFPHILLEGCSSGGGRFDPAMLYYSPQFWTSDDTDAMERIAVQMGTSVVYPASSISCHVSASPNHQTGRETSFETRGNVAMSGAFGYELDLTLLTEEEKAMIRRQVTDYHRNYELINKGELYRLIYPDDCVNGKRGNCAAWMYVSEDQSEALVTFVVIRTSVHPVYFLKLRGLQKEAVYMDESTGKKYFGDTLMNAGVNLTKKYKDGDSVVLHLIRCDKKEIG